MRSLALRTFHSEFACQYICAQVLPLAFHLLSPLIRRRAGLALPSRRRRLISDTLDSLCVMLSSAVRSKFADGVYLLTECLACHPTMPDSLLFLRGLCLRRGP